MKPDLTFALVRAAGILATYCDRVEHSEVADRQSVTAVALSLRGLAVATSHETGFDLHALYAERISEVERRHPRLRTTCSTEPPRCGSLKRGHSFSLPSIDMTGPTTLT